MQPSTTTGFTAETLRRALVRWLNIVAHGPGFTADTSPLRLALRWPYIMS
jgi:hypothetical protein